MLIAIATCSFSVVFIPILRIAAQGNIASKKSIAPEYAAPLISAICTPTTPKRLPSQLTSRKDHISKLFLKIAFA